MLPLIALGAVAAVPIVAAILWRVNSILLFTSVAVGDLLVRYLGEDASLITESFYKGPRAAMATKLTLLFLPVLFTLLFGKHSLSRFRAILHFVPIVATGIVLAFLTLPLLTGNFQASVYNSSFGTYIKNTQDMAIAGAGVASLVVAWLTNQQKHDKRR